MGEFALEAASGGALKPPLKTFRGQGAWTRVLRGPQFVYLAPGYVC